jgi:DNA-binding transcriptional regulator YiaG
MKPADLKALREREQMTQQEMANKLGVAIVTYQQWEYGRRKMNAATRRLIEVLFPEGGRT